jgi:hypothetical protein
MSCSEILPSIVFHLHLGLIHLSTILSCKTVELLVDTGLELFVGQVNKNDAS